jgi:Phage integrase family
MSSSEDTGRWVVRWRCEMAATSLRRGIWRLRGGGFFVRARVTDPRTGREYQLTRVLRGPHVAVREALEAQAQLRRDGVARIEGRIRSRTLWSTYAASLFEAKVTEKKIKSASSRRRWADTLALLLPVFGMFYVDELRYADLVAWRDQIARWTPSRRKRDAGKNRIVRLSPVTANGWISLLKVICAAMTKQFELEKTPAAPLEYFATGRTYTREQPNALTAKQARVFLTTMKRMFPQHYAMVFLGFISGARPSTLRPLRRQGEVTDLKWDERVILLRRSNSLGDEIMDETKTALDQEIPLPPLAVRVLRDHIAGLPEGPMSKSPYLFPSVTGGLRSRSALDKPFADVLKALGWTIRLTPRGMRRTFNDLARDAEVHDVVTRAISGHETERMQRHYSTAQREEMRQAVGRVISLAVEREKRQTPRRKRRTT